MFLAVLSSLFFFNDTSTTEIYTLSLHDALPIWTIRVDVARQVGRAAALFVALASTSAAEVVRLKIGDCEVVALRSEEHTSELQSRQYLVCRLLLEKKKQLHSRIEHKSR